MRTNLYQSTSQLMVKSLFCQMMPNSHGSASGVSSWSVRLHSTPPMNFRLVRNGQRTIKRRLDSQECWLALKDGILPTIFQKISNSHLMKPGGHWRSPTTGHALQCREGLLKPF